MRAETKLASVRGVFQKMNLQTMVHSARRLIEGLSESLITRPLRDIDDWSDQSEVAYYEEALAKRA